MTDIKSTLMWKEINETPLAFSKIKKNNQKVMENLLIDIKANPINGVYAAGRGTSDHALVYFKYVCEIFAGIPVAYAGSSIVTIYNGKLNLKNQLVIGCSQSGKAADVLEVIRRANSQGAITVSVTNDENSPLAKEAKYHLFCSAGEEKSVAATKTFSTQLYLMLYLASSLAGNQKAIDMLDTYTNELPSIMEVISSETEKLAPNFISMESGFILARGVTYPIALEGALKLQETSYVQMKGYPASDFYHGPMAMINSDTPVFIYAPKFGYSDNSLAENHKNDQVKCIEKMIELGAKTVIITDDSDYQKYSDKACVSMLPKACCESFAMFNFALFAQMFACRISCGKGRNPDSPRALNKVTITK